MEKLDKDCTSYGKTLGEIVAGKVEKATEDIARLQEQMQMSGFLTLGQLIQDFLLGKIRFVATGKVTVSGEAGSMLERCKGDGLGFEELHLQKIPLDDLLMACRNVVAELSYLLLKGAIVPHPAGYVPPDYQGIASIIDVDEMLKRFPELSQIPGVAKAMAPRAGIAVIVGIAVVDVVVLIIDAVRFKKA